MCLHLMVKQHLQLSKDVLLFRANSGNPAVPVAQRQAAASQHSPIPGDSIGQSLSFGKPSSDGDGLNSVKTPPSCPALAEARQQDSKAASMSIAGPETARTQAESRDQSAGSPSPVSMQTRDQNVARQQHDLGPSAPGQATSASETSSSGQAPGHIHDKYESTQLQAASGPGSAMTLEAQPGAVGPASSSHQILEQQGGSDANPGPHSSRDANDLVPVPLSDRDTKLGAAQEGVQRLLEAANYRLPDLGEWHGSCKLLKEDPRCCVSLSWPYRGSVCAWSLHGSGWSMCSCISGR